MLGYYKRPDIEPFDAEGWLDTGDLAFMDEEGYIRIAGRTKDLIIRGAKTYQLSISKTCCWNTRLYLPLPSLAILTQDWVNVRVPS